MANSKRATETGRASSSPLVEALHVDEEGRKWAVMVPAGHHDASMGIPIGPPDIGAMGLPLDTEIRLHNQLYQRRLFTLRDVRRRPEEMKAAIQAAFKVDFQRVSSLYA